MPKLPPPPDEHTTFERLPGEPPVAWHAFTVYRDMGPTRTFEQARKILGKTEGYLTTIEQWSMKWKWAQRCMKWDALIDAKTREAAFDRMPLWEARRQESLERNMEAAATIRGRLLEMTSHPLIRERTRDDDKGGQIVIIEPAKWNWNAVIAGFKMIAELEAATIAEGLLEADDEDFDIEAASAEELRAFLQRHRRRKGIGTSGSDTPILDPFKRES